MPKAENKGTCNTFAVLTFNATDPFQQCMFRVLFDIALIYHSPISLLILISKIAAMSAAYFQDRFRAFNAGEIYPLQHGRCIKGRSTITQLLYTVHRITRAIDQG